MTKKATKPTTAKLTRLRCLADDKLKAVQSELEVTEATAATFKNHEERLLALERRAGVPGPQGPKGEPGAGFWG